jgi:hypothetical protein
LRGVGIPSEGFWVSGWVLCMLDIAGGSERGFQGGDLAVRFGRMKDVYGAQVEERQLRLET